MVICDQSLFQVKIPKPWWLQTPNVTVYCHFLLSRVQPRLLPLPAGLRETVSTGLHLRSAAPQPLPGELGGPVLRPGLPALQPCLPNLLRHWADRLPVLSSSQSPGPHLLPAPEPGAAQVPAVQGAAGGHSTAGGADTIDCRRQGRGRRASRFHQSSPQAASHRCSRAQLCLHPGCLHRTLPPAANALQRRLFWPEDQTAFWAFGDESGFWFWLRPRTGEESTDILQGDPHRVGERGRDHLPVWIRRRGSGRWQREDRFH